MLGWGGWQWLWSQPRQGRLPWPLRRVLEANRRLWQAYFHPDRTAPTYPVGRAQAVPVNGDHGLEGELDPAAWRLVLEGSASYDRRELTLDDVLAVGTTEVVTELRCIEGWTRIAHWSGVRLADLLAAHPVADMDSDRPPHYVAFETPDRGYYVGLDLATALHPQTLLAYRLNGEPLTPGHGAPLRLVVPIAYGIKSLKRLGRIRLTTTRPDDYWAERGYDWYSVH